MKDSIINIAKKAVKSELVSGSFFILIAGTLGGFLAFLFNFFLIRKISQEDYGIFISLVSFSVLLAIPAQSLNVSIIQYATPLFAKNEFKKSAYLYVTFLKYVGTLSIIIFVFFLVLSGMLGNFLHITNTYYIWIIGLAVALGYFSIVNAAFIQALLKFSFLAIINFVGNGAKLTLGVIFVLLGFRVFGALGAVIAAGFIPIFAGFYPLWFLIKSEKEKIVLSKRDVFSYAISVSIISLALTSFTSTDVILVKHFFSPSEAGLYSGLSLVGKVIFYLTAPISTVLFPLIIKKYHKGEDFLKTFYLALGIVFLPSICISLFYFLFPKFTISFFLGGKGYLALTPYVGIYSLFLVVFSLLNITTTFLLSLKKISVVFPLGFGAIVQIVCIYFLHKDFFQVIYVSLIIASILLVAVLLYYVKNYESKNTQKTAPTILNSPNI